jgi:hypothetical protein
MRKFIKRKRAMAAVGGVALLIAAAGAYAYFTNAGGGTSAGAVGTAGALVLHGTTGTTLYPGTSTPVTFTVDNLGSGNQRLGTITLDSVSAGAATGCGVVVGTDFSMPPIVVNQTVTPGSGKTVTGTSGTITMIDTGASQDACKNAVLTFTFTST